MAINGWCNIKSTAWGKKIQDQTQQIGVNQVPNAVSFGRGSRYSYWNYCQMVLTDMI